MPTTSGRLKTIILSFGLLLGAASASAAVPANFSTENLVAWCIAHNWDSENRSPAERGELLNDLGLRRYVYNWRREDNPDFEAEILESKKHGIEYFAFWNEDETAFNLFEKYGLKPQIWKVSPSPHAATQELKLAAAVKRLLPFAQRAQKLGSKFGLYNHRNWGGHPENLVAVCQELRRLGCDNVGIVYNFHHAHEEMDRFSEYLELMQPYLLCLNLNGMAEKDTVNHQTLENKILPIGSGIYETEMIKAVIASGYTGPIGILGHKRNEDVAQTLRGNIEGLRNTLQDL